MSNNLLKLSQHGFLPGKSTVTNLIDYLEVLTQHLDQGKVAGMFLAWIEDWLTNRSQRVVLNGHYSEWTQVLSGVPQGSVLGPILFLIFINDIDCVLDATSTILFKFAADDSKLLKVIEGEIDRDKLQDDINALHKWCSDWGMMLNLDKCKVLHCGHNNPCYSYVIDGYAPAGHVIAGTDEEKDLGVIIHKSVKPSRHCAEAAKKGNMVLGQMARAFTYRDKTWVRLYTTYVRPHLQYAVQAWCPWLQADVECLEKVQRRAVNMVSGLQGTSYEERLSELGLTTLAERRARGDMLLMWRARSGSLNMDPDQWFTAYNNSGIATRQNSGVGNVVKPRANREIRRNFFTVRTVDTWNSLPAAVKCSKTINNFKINYDDHMMSLR